MMRDEVDETYSSKAAARHPDWQYECDIAQMVQPRRGQPAYLVT